jgi:hypothetical protein
MDIPAFFEYLGFLAKEVMDIESVLANKEMVFLKKGFIFQGKLLP